MKRLIRQLKWRWILIGALLIIGRFTLVWAGNVSTNIEDTGTNVGIGTTSPGAKLTVAGTSAAQPSSGPSSTAISRIRGSNGAVLDFGSASVHPYGMWIQATDPTNFAASYPIVLNPNGGNVGIETTNPTSKLHITGSVPSTVAEIYNTDVNNGTGMFIKAGGVNSGKYALSVQSNAGVQLLQVLANGNVG